MNNRYRGKEIFMRTLENEGVRYIFGNPGTTELPLIDSLLNHTDIEYILALHESVAVSMADAYAQASGNVGVVNLHVGPGLGNGLGAMYNAWEGQTPLVVTAGQQDNRMRLREPLLGHDLVAMAGPLTKWSVEAQSADELPLVLNRAFKTARETPSGPVFVSLPMNVMEQATAHAPMAPSGLYSRTPPDPAGIEAALEILLSARKPLIVCGDKVARAGAVRELVEVAERIGAAVYSVVLPARLNFPNQHPHFRDRMANDQAAMRERVGDSDVVLLAGGEFFEETWFADASPFPESTRVIQIDPSPANLGRNYRVDVGLSGDVKIALGALAKALSDSADGKFLEAAKARCRRLGEEKRAVREIQAKKAAAPLANGAMSAARLMAELEACAPGRMVVASEAITASPDMLKTLSFETPDDLLMSRGGGIGQGLPSALGVKLAHPDRPVLCISGDGSACYTLQALWSAAHHRLPVVFLILNNGSYRILKLNMDRYRRDAGIPSERPYLHMDLSDPAIDFVTLAGGYGVKGERVSGPDQLPTAIRTAFESNEPYLLDVVIDGGV
ncbi:MAG: thiamine pyrophosphate-binding protein [Gammaproteobacteria bacterium]|nr:thiamine pyrophosphate-binding protein [Gammaproteobacteria bacterium]